MQPDTVVTEQANVTEEKPAVVGDLIDWMITWNHSETVVTD